MRNIYLVLIGILVHGAVFADDLPQGWRTPKKLQQSGCDRKNSDMFITAGDFDGDKKQDTARLLVKDSGKGLGVWVWLSSQKEPILAGTTDHEDGKHDMAIGHLRPGMYKSMCGKGAGKCAKNEKAKLRLKTAAIDFFSCESAHRILFWSVVKSKFEEVWIGD